MVSQTSQMSRVDPSAMVCLNGVASIQYCADSGSDWNIISALQVRELQQKDQSVSVYELSKPVVCRTMGGSVTSSEAVDLFVTLHTAAGPVRCQDRKQYLMVDSDEGEFIVGKPILVELGIDIDRQLEMLVMQAVDMDADDPFELTVAPVPCVRADVSEAEVIEDMLEMGTR